MGSDDDGVAEDVDHALARTPQGLLAVQTVAERGGEDVGRMHTVVVDGTHDGVGELLAVSHRRGDVAGKLRAQ